MGYFYVKRDGDKKHDSLLRICLQLSRNGAESFHSVSFPFALWFILLKNGKLMCWKFQRMQRVWYVFEQDHGKG